MRQSDLSSRAELVGAAMAAIRRLGTEVDGLDQRAANRFGISRTDLHVIDRLRSEGSQTPSQLARSVGLTSGGLSIALERLERIGYIHRSQHPDDRRSVLVQATEAIVPLEDEVFGPLIQEMTSLFDTYGDRDLSTIRDFLDAAATVISGAGRHASESSDHPSGPGRSSRGGRRSQRERPGPG
jgi:DNA-binding MarR family transcriptional regulator